MRLATRIQAMRSELLTKHEFLEYPVFKFRFTEDEHRNLKLRMREAADALREIHEILKEKEL